MAEPARSSLRLGVVLALAIVALFEVLTLLQGLRSTQRLQARVTHDVRQAVEDERGRLIAGLEGRGREGWSAVAARARDQGLAAEVEVLDRDGQVLFAHPTPPPVARATIGTGIFLPRYRREVIGAIMRLLGGSRRELAGSRGF